MANSNINERVLPDVNSYTEIYRCESNFIGNIIATNVSGTTLRIRIAMRPLGATLADSHHLIYDYILPAGQNFTIYGLALNGSDAIDVYTDGECSFNLFGVSR